MHIRLQCRHKTIKIKRNLYELQGPIRKNRVIYLKAF